MKDRDYDISPRNVGELQNEYDNYFKPYNMKSFSPPKRKRMPRKLKKMIKRFGGWKYKIERVDVGQYRVLSNPVKTHDWRDFV